MTKWPSPSDPKPLEASLTEREEKFMINLVDNKMEPLEAFKAAGYKDGDKYSLTARSKRLQRHLWLHIEQRIGQKVGETATLALNVVEELLRSGESENVRLNAARDILSRAGYDATQKSETTIKEVSELSDEELDKQIEQLTKNNIVSLPSRKSE
jgi:hypothetical protein